jgi:hypothetical protein
MIVGDIKMTNDVTYIDHNHISVCCRKKDHIQIYDSEDKIVFCTGCHPMVKVSEIINKGSNNRKR